MLQAYFWGHEENDAFFVRVFRLTYVQFGKWELRENLRSESYTLPVGGFFVSEAAYLF
jgi:hypothetical protein